MSTVDTGSLRRSVNPGDLQLDPHNPRLADLDLGPQPTQDELLAALCEKLNVDEVAMSIASAGYLDYEPLIVAEEDGRFTVIEGNRRLAAVRLLLDPELRRRLKKTDLPAATPEILEGLELLPVAVTTRRHAWQYLGFKHVNGPAPWGSFAKAQYLSRVHREYNVPLEAIAQQIGDRHLTVRRLYRAVRVLEEAEETSVFHRDDRYARNFNFSHLYTGLGYESIQKHLSLASEGEEAEQPVPEARLGQLGEVLTWLYGSRTRDVEPLVQRQNPDLRQLAEVLTSTDATEALRAGMPLNLALDVAAGDERLFRDALHEAKQQLQRALATVATGFAGERGQRELVYDLVELANELADRVDRKMRRPRRTLTAPEEAGADGDAIP